MVGLLPARIAIEGFIAKASGGEAAAGHSPVDLGEQVLQRTDMTDGHGISLGRVLAGATRDDFP